MNKNSANEKTTPDSAPNPGEGETLVGIGDVAEKIGARNLWIIILTMPAFFLVLLAVIIAFFGKSEEEKLAEQLAAEQEEMLIPWTEPGDQTATRSAMPVAGGHGAIALDGDRLAVRVDGPDGFVVVVYDLAEGEEIARLPFPAE